MRYLFDKVFDRIDFFIDHPGITLLIPSISLYLSRNVDTNRIGIIEIALVWFNRGIYVSYIRPLSKILKEKK